MRTRQNIRRLVGQTVLPKNISKNVSKDEQYSTWKVSRYRVYSGPYFPTFRPEKTPYLDTVHTVSTLENSAVTQKNLRLQKTITQPLRCTTECLFWYSHFASIWFFFSFAQSRSKTLNTGLVRRATFKGNVTDYLAVNNTAADLDRAASFEDLFREGNSPPTNNPFISDQSYNMSNNPFSMDQSNESKVDLFNQSNSNPFQQSTLNPFSSGTDSLDIVTPTIVGPQSSTNESNTCNLIDF